MTEPQKIDDLLMSPCLLDMFVAEFDKIMPAQQEQKRLMILVLASSRCTNLNERLHLLINSESSAGKSYFAKQFQWLLRMEEFEYYTRVSPKALAYLHPEGEWTWDGKCLFLEDVTQELLDSDVFKVFASEGARTVVVDKGKARILQINGTPVIILTSAAGVPKTEILNRFILLNLDESERQTREIFRSAARQESLDELFYDAFCMLERCRVTIPYQDKIAEKFPAKVVRARRDYQRFLSLIKASATLHQKQRKSDDSGAVLANEQDFRIAMQLFAYANPASFDIDLTHVQKKAFEQLQSLAQRCPSMSHVDQLQLCDDEGHDGGSEAPTCTCGSVHLSRACIYAHFPNRSLRKWYALLERLAEKGVIKIRTMVNPKTKHEITVYTPKKTDTMDTLDIIFTESTSLKEVVKVSAPLGVSFSNSANVTVAKASHTGIVGGANS